MPHMFPLRMSTILAALALSLICTACASRSTGSAAPPPAADPPAAPQAPVETAPAVTPSTAPATSADPAPAPGFRIVPDDRPGRGAYGRAPTIDPSSNAQVQAVADAAHQGTHPERLSPLVPPTPFDAAAWERDPAAYLAGSEPGRPWQTAEPGSEVPVLRKSVMGNPELVQGTSTELSVQAPPGAPVSWTILDLGVWENGLVAITTRADATGRATARFHATSGSLGRVNVIAGSPLASGQVRWGVTVVPPAGAGPGGAVPSQPAATTPSRTP